MVPILFFVITIKQSEPNGDFMIKKSSLNSGGFNRDSKVEGLKRWTPELRAA